jgi:hypothetical protein
MRLRSLHVSYLDQGSEYVKQFTLGTRLSPASFLVFLPKRVKQCPRGDEVFGFLAFFEPGADRRQQFAPRGVISLVVQQLG